MNTSNTALMSIGMYGTRVLVMWFLRNYASLSYPPLLQHHLCGLGTRELVSDTILQLSGGVHDLKEGPFCLLQKHENITIICIKL